MEHKIVSMLLYIGFFSLGVVYGLCSKYFSSWIEILYVILVGVLATITVSLRERDK